MKKIILLFILLTTLLNAQQGRLQLFWDLDNDKTADVTYTCSDGDTIIANLYLTNVDTAIANNKPIYAFEIPVMYGYYTRWNSSGNYTNILTIDSVYYDSTAVADSSGVFNFHDNPDLKRFNMSYYNSGSVAIVVDSCIASITFIVSGTGNQYLHFNYLGEEDNYNVFYNTAVLDDKSVNYSLWVRDCLITSE